VNRDGSDRRTIVDGIPAGMDSWTGIQPLGWSPTGDRIAGVDLEGRLVVVDVATGAARATPAGVFAGEPSWSPYGDRLATWLGEQLSVIDAATGTVTALYTTPEYAFELAWSPDGSEIAFLEGVPAEKGPRLAAISLTDRTIREIAGPAETRRDLLWSPAGDQLVWALAGNLGGAIDSLFRVPADGSAPPSDLADVPEQPDTPIAWSPDGANLVFVTAPVREECCAALWIVGADGSNLREVIGGLALADYGTGFDVTFR